MADRAEDGRDESVNERMDRNWNEILQELRVTQTGTQILLAFLLAVAFQAKFEELDDFELTVYLLLVVTAALTTVMALAPVGLHRLLFRQQEKAHIVRIAHRMLEVTLIGVALTLTGTVLLIFDYVLGRAAGLLAGGSMLAFVTALIAGLLRRRRS